MDKILINVKTNSFIDGENDIAELITEGEMYDTPQSIYLKYKESEVTGLAGSDTTIKIGQDQVTILRKGSVNSQMIFVEGQTRFSHYETPYGPLNMKIYTFKLNKEVDRQQGIVNLDMKYQLSINDGQEIINTISLNSKKV